MKKSLSSFFAALCLLVFSHPSLLAQPGVNWTSQTTPATSQAWNGVAYGNGLFVAVAGSGTGNRVMTSPDGVTWTLQTTPADNNWIDVIYDNGLFVAIGSSGTGNRVMTSPDGVAWTLRTTPFDNNWSAITYGNGLFVVVAGASSGTGNRVMTSSDGITWTLGTTPADNNWSSVTYANGLFVAVAASGTNRVMTSPDGFTWTLRNAAANVGWSSVAYGNGLFVAVSGSLAGNHVMTSPDGINWTANAGVSNLWQDVVYANGLFVAVARSGTGSRVMTSPDGLNWTARTTPADNDWGDITYGAGSFVAVAYTGTGNQVMTSGSAPLPLHWVSVNTRLTSANQARIDWQVEEQEVSGYDVEKSTDGSLFKTIGSVQGQGNGRHNYSFTEAQPLTGTAYYRIKQNGHDGRPSYSNIVTLHQRNDATATLYPNPAKDFVTIAVGEHLLNKNAVVTDFSGKVLQSVKITGRSFTLNTKNYTAGSYFIKVDRENAIKFIKE